MLISIYRYSYIVSSLYLRFFQLLAEEGRIESSSDPQTSVRRMLDRLPLKEAVVKRDVAIQSRNVDLPHQDPAVRFLGATAVLYDSTLVTANIRMMRSESFRCKGMSFGARGAPLAKKKANPPMRTV